MSKKETTIDDLARMVAEGFQEMGDRLSDEIKLVRTELKQEIAGVRTELKQEIAGVRTELKNDIYFLGQRMDERFDQIKGELKSIKEELKYLKKERWKTTILSILR